MILRPLDDVAGAIGKLNDRHDTAQLADALQATSQAVDRSLRNLLRTHSSASDDVRFSGADALHDRLVSALRQHNLISLQLAGMIHELEQSVRRAARGLVDPADGDHALRVIQRLRNEVSSMSDRPVMAAAHNAIGSGMLDMPARDVPEAAQRKSWPRKLGIAAVFLLLAFLLVILASRKSDLELGIAAVQAERWSAAQEYLERAAQQKNNATAQLYLARVYRRLQRYERAAAVLQEAASRHDQDADIFRELGYLFLDLNQPRFAIQRFRRAVELAPEEKLNWIGLVRALREADDPAADRVLQTAPPEVRAALTRSD